MRGKRWRRYESLSISERYTVRPYQASVNVTVPAAAFLPVSLIYFCSDKLVYFHSGVDPIRQRCIVEPGEGKAKKFGYVIR